MDTCSQALTNVMRYEYDMNETKRKTGKYNLSLAYKRCVVHGCRMLESKRSNMLLEISHPLMPRISFSLAPPHF